MNLVTEAIQDYINTDNLHTVTYSYIVDIVADHYGITSQEIYSKNRSKTVAYARQIAMYLCKKYLSMSLVDIGKSIGDRDHSTVIHACKLIEKELKDDIPLQNTIDVLAKKINLQ